MFIRQIQVLKNLNKVFSKESKTKGKVIQMKKKNIKWKISIREFNFQREKTKNKDSFQKHFQGQ